MELDWKEKLSALRATLPQADPSATTPEEPASPVAPRQTGPLHIVYEKKGRKGKPATIIEGLTIGAEAVEALASERKKKLGVGGSWRESEILVQGDRRDDAAAFLRSKGFRCR